ncbi:BPSS1780 family membrane protein [Proteus vulgaris]|uniref:BPSS1780 family membrane protein n=1 Tax=Proteus vulgaris TaxID=585 RepID=UPI0025415DCC|nr:BPSS1780 family membrane protein [Proteus vulgaris]WIF73479.1 BPSS1780 family membrane protein [Proteus vulgaris]
MEQDNNSSQTEPQEIFTPIPQARGASGGVRWLGLGWDLIKERFWMWIGVIIIYFIVSLIISTILGFIPLIGPIISPFITTVLAAGVVAIAHQQYETQRIDVDNLFFGFYNKRYLSLMGAYGISFLILLVGIILAVVVSSATMMDIFYAINSDYPDEIIAEMMMDNSSGFTLFFVIIAIFGALSTAAYWFVPALALVNGYKAFPAVKASLAAVKINLSGGFFFFILLFFIIAISIIPFGLGLLITIPLSYTAMYGSYRDIFYHHNIGNQGNNGGVGGNGTISLNKTAESNIGKLVS